ncbi:MAG: hypothetical protein IJ527_01585 [Prevotella sp.]|nr:hypothetical protein [Prevotella sp.]
MDKKTRNILIIVAAIVVLGPVLLIGLGLVGFIAADLFHSVDTTGDVVCSSGGFSLGSALQYLGIAIIVIGVPLVLFFTRKKK